MTRIDHTSRTRFPLVPVNIRFSPAEIAGFVRLIVRAVAFNTTLPGRYRGVA